MAQQPAYAFTIPSLADDIALDCRLYHPENLGKGGKQTPPRGAILAHPYAPLGGCYDDFVVLESVQTLVNSGHVVATFNFRGAGESAGRTSWTGKPEMEDYSSVVGLLLYYLHHLEAPQEETPLSPVLSTSNTNFDPEAPLGPSPFTPKGTVHLLLGGYSFGSLILAQLPPVQRIVERFELAERGSAGSEIFLRARTLAKRTNASLEEAIRPSTSRGRPTKTDEIPASPKARASPVTVGGEETDPFERRRSRDSKRSSDIVRDVPNRIKSHIRRYSGSGKHAHAPDHHHRPSTASTVHYPAPKVVTSYLLISPVLLPLTTVLSPPGIPLSLALPFVGSGKLNSGLFSRTAPCLLLFGSQDTFTAAKRLRQWAERLARDSSGRLEWAEVPKAGHFWRESGVMEAMQTKIASWAGSGL